MLDDPTFQWSLANPYGIQVNNNGNVWHAGCVRDLLVTNSGATLVASDTGGVWSVTPSSSVSLADLDPPDLSCLGQGPRSPEHAYTGGSALYETDITQGVPLLAWKSVPIVDASGTDLGAGWVFRVGVTRERRRLVLACSTGVFWAEMTYPTEEPPGCLGALLGFKPTPKPPAPYAFTKIPVLPGGNYFGLAMGPGDRIAVAPWGDGATLGLSGLFFADSTTGGMLFQRATILGSGFHESDMRATTLAACASKPAVMYAISSDQDGFFLGLLRSDDGGATWRKMPLNVKNLPAGKTPRDILGNQGNDSRPCNAIAVAPNNSDVAVIAWRHQGLLITTDGGKQWEMHEGGPHVHPDLHCVIFDPRDPSGQTVLVGSDGGVASTTDLGGSFDSAFNQQLPILQFQSYPARMFYGSFSGSRFVTGLIAGGLQDNGNVSSVVQGGALTPWLRFGRQDDGMLTLFVENGRSLYYFNDDSNVQSVTWDPSGQPHDHSWDMLRDTDPGGPQLIDSLVVAALRNGSPPDHAGHRIYAVGVRNTNLYAYLSLSDGSDGHWIHLADFGVDFGDLTAAGSFDGATIFLGSSTGQLYRYDPLTRKADSLGLVLKTAKPGETINRILALSDREAYAAYNGGSGGHILQYLGHHFEEMGNGLPPSDWFYGIESFTDAEGQLVLLAASDNKVYVTRDRGASWLNASLGLPRRAHICDLSYVHQQDGNAFVYIGSYGRSAWVSQVTYSIDIHPR